MIVLMLWRCFATKMFCWNIFHVRTARPGPFPPFRKCHCIYLSTLFLGASLWSVIGYYCICMRGSADIGADCTEKFVVRQGTAILARPQSVDELKATSLALPKPVTSSQFRPWRQKIKGIRLVLATVRYRMPKWRKVPEGFGNNYTVCVCVCVYIYIHIYIYIYIYIFRHTTYFMLLSFE